MSRITYLDQYVFNKSQDDRLENYRRPVKETARQIFRGRARLYNIELGRRTRHHNDSK